MPRTSRAIVANYCYHVLSRGNNRMRLFHDRADYIAFLWLLAEALDEIEVPVLAALATRTVGGPSFCHRWWARGWITP